MTYEQWEALRFVAGPLDKQRLDALIGIASALGKLGPNAVALVADLADRLVLGVPYGDWDTPRDMVRETHAEVTDGLAYTGDELRRAEARVAALRRVHRCLAAADEALRNVPAE